MSRRLGTALWLVKLAYVVSNSVYKYRCWSSTCGDQSGIGMSGGNGESEQVILVREVGPGRCEVCHS